MSAEAEVIEAARTLAETPEATVRDEAQGLCIFCGDGWRHVPGPRGGKGKLRHVDAHAPGCPFNRLQRAVFALDDSDDVP